MRGLRWANRGSVARFVWVTRPGSGWFLGSTVLTCVENSKAMLIVEELGTPVCVGRPSFRCVCHVGSFNEATALPERCRGVPQAVLRWRLLCQEEGDAARLVSRSFSRTGPMAWRHCGSHASAASMRRAAWASWFRRGPSSRASSPPSATTSSPTSMPGSPRASKSCLKAA